MSRVAAQVKLAAQILALRTRVKWLLRTRALDDCVARLTPNPRPIDGDPTETLARIGGATDALLRRFRPTRTACLVRALVRYRLLRQEGLDASFVIGVRKGQDGALKGHSWVILEGEAVMEREDWRAYRSQFEYPAADRRPTL